MALMVCPECQKQISDTTELCPHCGYSIIQYIEQRELDHYISSKVDELSQKLEQELNEIDGLSAPRPLHTAGADFFLVLWSIACVIATIIGVQFTLEEWKFASSPYSDFPSGILIMWWVFWALLLFVEFCGVSGLVARHRKWRYNCDHLDEYKSKEKEACKERYAERIRLLQERNEEAIKVERKSDGIYDSKPVSQIKCPTCGSTQVTKISAGTRMIDGAVFGKLSVEGRAQFRCESCGYKW